MFDTNYDPNLANILILANDNVIASIKLILNRLVFAICDNIYTHTLKWGGKINLGQFKKSLFKIDSTKGDIFSVIFYGILIIQ